MRKSFEQLTLPPSVLALLEGYPVVMPSFPTIDDKNYLDSPDDLDTRLIPGGPASSALLRQKEKLTQEDLESLLQEIRRVHTIAKSMLITSSGLNNLSSFVSSAITSINAATGSAALIDYYTPGTALQTSVCAHESLWGQVTLPYANSPQSLIRRDSRGARPGTVVKYSYGSSVSWNTSYVSNAVVWDETDPEALLCADGHLDTSWMLPIGEDTDLIVSITLPPTMAANAFVNAVGIIPWPLGGTSIVDVQVRTGDTVVGLSPGWKQLSLEGQPNYNGSIIDGALAHRFLFTPSTVKEIVVRLRPKDVNTFPTNIGLTLVDCWSIDFKPAGTVVLDTSEVGINNVSRVTLGGHSPTTLLDDVSVTVVGSQVTLNLSSAGPGVTPVLTSTAITAVTNETTSGFDVDVFTP